LLVDAFGQAVVDVEVSAPVCFVPVVGPAHLGAVLGAVAAEADEFRLVRDGLEVGGERREFDVGREIDDVAPFHDPVADVVGVVEGSHEQERVIGSGVFRALAMQELYGMVCPDRVRVGAELTGYPFGVFVAEELEALNATDSLNALPGIRPQMQLAGVVGTVTGLAKVCAHRGDAGVDRRPVDLDAGPVRHPTGEQAASGWTADR